MDLDTEESANYIHVAQNEFLHRKHKKQKEEDIATCECKFDFSDTDTACGERCWNVLTSTECTPGYCHCGVYCKNQKFQKCQYAKTRLFKTEGRGWGLLADENIKAGQFIIEYCGEVISWKEAKKRAYAYENQGLRDAYIISLNASECIDATKKGSLARFINHSCQPNCETRKWTVLGEIRVGIFAKQDIPAGIELAYNYNFEWYGGAKVRCLCGAASCCGFLGAKSRGFQEDTYLWEDDDDRYSVEKIPLYDSAEDEPLSKYSKTMDTSTVECSTPMKTDVESAPPKESKSLVTQALDLIPVESVSINHVKSESKDTNMILRDSQQALPQNNAMISRIRSNSACRNYQIGPEISKKRSKPLSNGKLKNLPQKNVDAKCVVKLLSSKEAQEEVLKSEEIKNDATSELDSLYNDIRPAIEEHERDNQDCVATSVAEKWIEACCAKLKAEFDLYSSVVRNVAYHSQRLHGDGKPLQEGGNESRVPD